jgi:hypothetical protein
MRADDQRVVAFGEIRFDLDAGDQQIDDRFDLRPDHVSVLVHRPFFHVSDDCLVFLDKANGQLVDYYRTHGLLLEPVVGPASCP